MLKTVFLLLFVVFLGTKQLRQIVSKHNLQQASRIILNLMYLIKPRRSKQSILDQMGPVYVVKQIFYFKHIIEH